MRERVDCTLTSCLFGLLKRAQPMEGGDSFIFIGW